MIRTLTAHAIVREGASGRRPDTEKPLTERLNGGTIDSGSDGAGKLRWTEPRSFHRRGRTRPDDFYNVELPTAKAVSWASGPNSDPFDASSWVTPATSPSRTLNVGLLESLRRGPDAKHDDVEIAGALARLVHDDLERYGTDSSQEMSEPEIRIAILALRAVTDRIGACSFTLPFREPGRLRQLHSSASQSSAQRATGGQSVSSSSAFDTRPCRIALCPT